MAADSDVSSSDPQIVGNAFVERYYNLLYETPEDVHKFYLENSVLGRPGPDGEMISVKSLEAVNDQIMSFDFRNSKIQILTADSQGSYKMGVIVLVTGILTGKDGLRKKFSQSFFLTPQKGSYFVLNDVFRYVSDVSVESADDNVEIHPLVAPLSSDLEAEPVNEVIELAKVPDQPAPNQIADTLVEETENAKEDGNIEGSDEETVIENNGHQVTEAKKPQQDAPKKSFASIVQSLAEKPAPFHVNAAPVKPKPVEQPRPVAAPKASEPVPENSLAKTTDKAAAEGGSIFVANLPMDATPEQLYETFKQFGAIKQDGIQVRSYKQERNCFGFVSFESASSVKDVLQASKESPIRIGNRRVSIEEKRASDSSKSSGRNGGYRNESRYRNDGRRPRGNNFNGGRGYGRRGYEGQGGDSYNGDATNQRVYQNGKEKVARDQAEAGN